MRESGFKGILSLLYPAWKLGKLNKIWRKRNSHNATRLGMLCNVNNITVGKYTYGNINLHDFGSNVKLEIGNFVSIADDVHFLVAGNHMGEGISTFPMKTKVLGMGAESTTKGPIVVEDDVWIGRNVTILSGVRIGKGAIVGAGAVVTKEVPPYSICCGVPAKVVKYRFGEDAIKLLQSVDFAELTKEKIEKNIELFYSDDVISSAHKILGNVDTDCENN